MTPTARPANWKGRRPSITLRTAPDVMETAVASPASPLSTTTTRTVRWCAPPSRTRGFVSIEAEGGEQGVAAVHDLDNPIHSMDLHAQLVLRAPNLPERARDAAQRVPVEAKLMAEASGSVSIGGAPPYTRGYRDERW